MPLSVGDAVLVFTGDTTQLDQAFNKVATEAGAKMGIAATAVEGMTKAMAVGQQGAVELGDVTNLAGEKVKESMYEARGEIGLLGEAFGIHLPRHVRSFVAELPGVGAAMSAAFQATAVLFLIDALIQGVEKIAEWAEHGERMRQAWEKASLQLEDLTIKEGDHTKSLELANLKLDDQISKLEKRPDRNKLQEALLEASIAADHLAASFSKDFEKMTEEIEAATTLTAQFSQGLSSVGRSGLGGDVIGSLLSGFASGAAGIVAVKDALTAVDEKLLEINKLRVEQANAKSEEEQIAAAKALAEAYGTLAQTSQKALSVVQFAAPDNVKLITQLSSTIVSATAAQKDFGLESENVQKRVRLAALQTADDADKAAKKSADELKRRDEAVIKSINERLTEEQKLYKKETEDSLKSVEQELAARKKALTEELRIDQQKLEGQIAAIDGEMKERELAAERDAKLLARQFQTRALTGKQYIESLKALYQQESQDLINALNRKELLVIQEAKNEAALRGKIITDADAKELKAYTELESKKAQVLIQADIKIEKQEDKVLKDAQKRFAQFGALFKAYEAELQRSGKASAAWGAAVGEAISSVMQAYAAGSVTFEQALQRMLASLIEATAREAEIQGGKQLALAFGSYPDFAAMEQHFASAALWFALGGALSIGASALSGGGSSGGGGGTGANPKIDNTNPNTQPGGTGQSGGRNVPHLAGGGLITAPTLAMIGEGGSREAVIPLNDSSAFSAIADALSQHLENGGGGGNNFYLQPKGMVSADTLGKLVKKISRQVQTGRARLVASNSHKLTRRA